MAIALAAKQGNYGIGWNMCQDMESKTIAFAGLYLPTSQHHAYLHWLPDW